MANEKVVLRRGPSSSIPSTKVPGTILIETDTGRAYVDDTKSNRIQIKDDSKLPLEGTAKKAESDVNGNSLVDRITTVETDSNTGVVTLKNEKGESKGTVVNSSYVDSEIKAIPQADYTQNDSAAADYIKNRPFYSEIGETTYLDGTFDFVEDRGLYIYEQESSLTFEEGKTYTVVFDGTSYSCIGYIPGSGAPVVLGNASIFDPSLSGGNNEPFLVFADYGQLQIGTNLTDASHAVKITGSGESIKKLDAKYLPDEISTAINNKMDKQNPTGTGSFSLNRKAGTTVGGRSFAEGHNTTASGDCSHAEGYNTTASGYTSHAEGYNTTASDDRSHAEGYKTTASGLASHAEGSSSTASGNSAHAEGYYTKASSEKQHVQGKFNIEDSSGTYADIIGNGTTEAKRSNASTVDWNGNAWYAGDVYVGSTSGTNKDSGSKKLATEEYVDSKKIYWQSF